MRKLYNSGDLSSEHIKVLESISGWSWSIKKNIPIIPYISTYDPQDIETDVQMATRISGMFSRNKLSPIYFPETKNNFEVKRLILFREQYNKGCLSKEIEDILIAASKPWSFFNDIHENNIFNGDKFDSYLCYNKLPNDIFYRCFTASHLTKEWHTRYLKKKLDIIDSVISGEIFDFESQLFSTKFTNTLRDYFNGETERRICSSLPMITI
jgi:hypothetical protein